MFIDYDPQSLPYGSPIIIGMSIQIFRIQDVDYIKNKVTIICQIRLYWRDERLRWNPAKLGGITKSRFYTDPSFDDNHFIWTPDIQYS